MINTDTPFSDTAKGNQEFHVCFARDFWIFLEQKTPQEPLQFTGGADGAECISRLPCVPWEGDPNSEEMAAWQVWTASQD